MLWWRAVDRASRLFWLLIACLLSASLYFGVNAEAVRRSARAASGALSDGDSVSLERVVDGDSLVVRAPDGRHVSVRLLGIRAFGSEAEREPLAAWGKAAALRLGATLRDRRALVALNKDPTDSHGRYLATLSVDDVDVGRDLVKQGLVLVYVRYPFEAMDSYLADQEAARAAHLGLWADPVASERAGLLLSEWRRESQ